MFFLVTQKWIAANDAAASQRIIQLMNDSHYGRSGRPWPKLITLWQNPREREIVSCWESPTRKELERAFSKAKTLETSIKHVRQLYPPHVQGYNAMVIRADPEWKPGSSR